MQRWYSYELTAPMGKNFAPNFKPHYTPKEMLEMNGRVRGEVYERLQKGISGGAVQKYEAVQNGGCFAVLLQGPHAAAAGAVAMAV